MWTSWTHTSYVIWNVSRPNTLRKTDDLPKYRSMRTIQLNIVSCNVLRVCANNTNLLTSTTRSTDLNCVITQSRRACSAYDLDCACGRHAWQRIIWPCVCVCVCVCACEWSRNRQNDSMISKQLSCRRDSARQRSVYRSTLFNVIPGHWC